MRLNLEIGDKKAAYLKVRGVSGTEDVVLLEHSASEGYNTKYFTKNGRDITAAVKAATYEFTAKPDKARKFSMKVKRSELSDDAFCQLVFVDDGVTEPDLVAIAVNANPELCAIPI